MTNEFKEALDAVNNSTCSALHDLERFDIVELLKADYNTIRLALKAMDALMGEPSERMEIKGAIQVDFNQVKQPSRIKAVHCWKAMRDQMLADLDKGE